MNNPGMFYDIFMFNTFSPKWHKNMILAKFNAWGKSLTDQMRSQFARAATDPDTKVCYQWMVWLDVTKVVPL